MNTLQSDNSDLRELSHAEQIQASGGRACYRNPRGSRNDYRFLRDGNLSIWQAQPQVWFGGRYQNNGNRINLDNTVSAFDNFCRSQGYRYIYN